VFRNANMNATIAVDDMPATSHAAGVSLPTMPLSDSRSTSVKNISTKRALKVLRQNSSVQLSTAIKRARFLALIPYIRGHQA